MVEDGSTDDGELGQVSIRVHPPRSPAAAPAGDRSCVLGCVVARCLLLFLLLCRGMERFGAEAVAGEHDVQWQPIGEPIDCLLVVEQHECD